MLNELHSNPNYFVKDQIEIYKQTTMGRKVFSQSGTLTISSGAGSARFNGTSINFSGRGGVPILGHEIGHTIFGGGYVDYRGQGCPSCPVGNVQVNENSVRRDLGIRLRNWYPNPNGGNKNYSVGEVWERNW